jgi:ABC-type uncharacterized transport system substrate-binding protein
MKTRSFLCCLAAFFLISIASSSFAADKSVFSTKPTTNNGKKWRIGYYEGGQYPDYALILKVVFKGLQNLGWLQIDFPDKPDKNHKALWEWASKNIKSDYLELVPDAYYSAGDFDKDLRPKVKAELIKRLNEKKDIDFMLAFGTWAGQDLATNEHHTPTMVCSTSDPIKSGIVKSADDSGYDHLHAKVEPERYERQIRLFNDIIGFKKLGVVYEDSVEGRTFAGIDSVEKVARERGFEIVSCKAPFNNVSQQEAEQGVAKCYAELAPKIDAAYITVHRGVTPQNFRTMLAPLYKQKIPTFSMLGANEVKLGSLMSIAQAGFKYVGLFHAEVLAKVLNGAKPRDIDQKWQDPPKIAINLKVAEIIGYDPPVDIMMAADEIYEQILDPAGHIAE